MEQGRRGHGELVLARADGVLLFYHPPLPEMYVLGSVTHVKGADRHKIPLLKKTLVFRRLHLRIFHFA